MPLIAQLLIRMFNTTFVGVDVLGDPRQTNFDRELVFSADSCYNKVSEKPPSEREPLDAPCLFRGMGFALCLCNTKSKRR